MLHHPAKYIDIVESDSPNEFASLALVGCSLESYILDLDTDFTSGWLSYNKS